MKRTLLALATASLMLPVAPALAVPTGPATDTGYEIGYGDAAQQYRGGRGRYDRNGRYREPRRVTRNERIWRDEDGNYRCRRENGTTGLIIGGAAGALAGRAVDTRGERTTGTIIGAVAGALAGREIDRGSARCR